MSGERTSVDRLSFEQPFRVDLDYYEGRADGIASATGVSVAEARSELAARHGFSSWRELRSHVEAMQTGKEPPTPFANTFRIIISKARIRSSFFPAIIFTGWITEKF